MELSSKIQMLNAGLKVRLVEVDCSAFSGPVLRMHPHALAHTAAEIDAAGGNSDNLPAKSIWWQGNEYGAYPFEITGLSGNAEGEQAKPVLNVANLNGVVSALCRDFDDMVKAKVTIYDTFADYLDAKNFPGGNPTADPLAAYKNVFYIDARNAEDFEAVGFTLSNPIDLQNLRIPTRTITSICTWCIRGQYRSGRGCDYTGNAYFDKNGNPVSDPAQDVCGGLFEDCEKRHGVGNPLPFGGFVTSSLISG